MTGGGDCPGLNAVIRAVSKSVIQQLNAQVIGFEDGFAGLIERKSKTLSFRDVSGILTLGGTVLGCSNRANPFNYHVNGGADVSSDVVDYYNELGLDAIVAIGGDGTMSISHQLAEKGLNIVGVPKTIDNDLMGTDRTFGFDSAVAIATDAIDRLQTTAQSHNRVMIIETMGRYAGWIALYAGVAGAADIILIPELEYDIDEIVKVCKRRESGGQQFTIITVAEGAKPAGGEMTVKRMIESSPDPVRLGGISSVVAHQIRDQLRSEVRVSVLGHIQRGGSPTAYDRVLATAFGHYAARMIAEKVFGRMVVLRESRLSSIDLSEVANKTRTVPLDHPVIGSALGVGTSFGSPGFDLRLAGNIDSQVVA